MYAIKASIEGAQNVVEIVRPISERLFEKKLKESKEWKNTFSVVKSAYLALNPYFEVAPDRYGGFGLFYRGKEPIESRTVLRTTPCGFVRTLPDGVTDWSVMTSERSNEQLLLVDPIRFVNSDCDPNCEYDFSSEAGVVQLRTKRRIFSGSELLVCYSDEYFDISSCKCRTNV